jgi:hypothetical protein
MVPVTTKPFMNNVVLSKMQRVSLHFFLLISTRIHQHITSCANRMKEDIDNVTKSGI